MNPEVRSMGPRQTIVRDQVFALSTITNRLKMSYNGQDVDWIDTGDYLAVINSTFYNNYLSLSTSLIITIPTILQTKRGMVPAAVRAMVSSPTTRTVSRKVPATRDHTRNQSQNRRSSLQRRLSTRSKRHRGWTSSRTRAQVRAVRARATTRPSP